MPASTRLIATLATLAGCGLAIAACGTAPPGTSSAARAQQAPACDPDNGGLVLPQGFCALVVADVPARARHIVVRENGDVLVAANRRGRGNQITAPGGVFVLRDADGDGRLEASERFGPERGGTGIDLRDEMLYFAPDDAVLRYRLPRGAMTPAAGPDTLVRELPATQSHTAKSIAVDDGRLFVNIGSPSNVCQAPGGGRGAPPSPGQDPCPELETRAGIWLFDATRTNQRQSDGERFATGIRNAVAIAVHPADDGLYVMQHGRDQLFQNWAHLGYTPEDGAEKPAEELLKVERGDDFGWPYCYYDRQLQRKVLAPEYGGDGEQTGRCAGKKDPIYGFPGHWAPNDMLFYTGTQFPARYRDGVFVVFHGSWNRAPLPQEGFNVAFLPLRDARAAGDFEVFADGFTGGNNAQAAHRPTGIAQGPDGSIYVTDDVGGRIWRILYRP